jgi:predicted nucleic acid-binding protein
MLVRAGLVTDANVLIDYASTDESVLALAARDLGRVIVPLPVLDEVDLLDVAACERLDIEVIEPTLEQLLEAGAQRGRLSFEDRLCLVVARDAGMQCVTNDRRLRAACGTASVPVMWSLELLLELVAAGQFPPDQALVIAEELHRISPRHITSDILTEFRLQVEASTRHPR